MFYRIPVYEVPKSPQFLACLGALLKEILMILKGAQTISMNCIVVAIKSLDKGRAKILEGNGTLDIN